GDPACRLLGAQGARVAAPRPLLRADRRAVDRGGVGGGVPRRHRDAPTRAPDPGVGGATRRAAGDLPRSRADRGLARLPRPPARPSALPAAGRRLARDRARAVSADARCAPLAPSGRERSRILPSVPAPGRVLIFLVLAVLAASLAAGQDGEPGRPMPDLG